MENIEIDIPSSPAAASRPARIVPQIPKTSNSLPEVFVGARKLLKDTPWMSSMGFGFVISAVLLSPAIAIWYLHIYRAKTDSVQVNWIDVLSQIPTTFEIYRASILSGLFCFVYFMTLTACTLAPIATKYSKTESIKKIGQIIGTLRYNVSFLVGSIILTAVYLNSGINQSNPDLYNPALDKLLNNIASNDPIATYIGSISKTIMSQQAYFSHIPYFLILLSIMLLIEKIGILMISLNFHKSFYTKRIKRNNLVLSSFETLSQRFGPPSLKPIKSGSVLKQEAVLLYVKRIFDGLLKSGRDSLILDDFLEEIDHPVATELFQFLDFNKSGDISLKEFEEAIQEAYDEKKTLLKAIKANEQVIDRIDKFFVSVILLFKLFTFLSRVRLSAIDIIKYLGSSAVLVRYLFDHFLEQLSYSVMHFLITHPYDVGDKIVLNEKVYKIKDMGFWKTTLINLEGKVSYVANHTLLGEKFGNYRRSDRMESNLLMALKLATSKEEIEMYIAAVNEFIRDNGKYLDGKIVIKDVQIGNVDAMAIVFGVTHKFNFNNDDSFHFRCELIFSNMIRIAKEQNLKYFTLRFQGE